jgi:YidC/Oxa1 family membrane protein insertase
MDRRTFLAFGLIFLILIGSQYLMKTFYPSPEPTEQVAAETVDQDAAATVPRQQPAGDPVPTTNDPEIGNPAAGPIVSPADALQPVNEPVPGLVTVTTPLYRLTLDTTGGRIVGWEGLAFKHHAGGNVQLVPTEIPAYGTDAIVFAAGSLDLGTAVFRTGTATLDLGEGEAPASLDLFVSLAGGMEVRKTFTFTPETYNIRVAYALVSVDGGPTSRSLELLGRPREVRFGWNQGIAPTERVQRLEEASMRSLLRVGDETVYKKRDGLKKDLEKVEAQLRGSVRFAGLQDRYFTVLGIVPQEQGEPVEGTARISGDQGLMAQSWALTVPARAGAGGEIATAELDLYIGPQKADLLAVYDQGLEKTMDLGWKLFRPLAEAVLWLLAFMHRYIPNYGVIIIIFSVLTKLAFYPLTKTSTESMKKMQELQPKMKALQEKYKNDKEKLNQATMKLYQEEKVNPLSGCLPLLVQSPVFIALYQGLNHTIELRGEPFVLWMKDLSQPDAITQLPFALPMLGADLNVLPILMSVAMYFQTKMTPTSGAGGQMAAMNTMMPLIMVFIFYNMPSGLVLYWLVNTILQGYQSWRIHQTAPSKGAQAT